MTCLACADPVWQNGRCKECNLVQWRMFLAWKLVWEQSMAVTIYDDKTLPEPTMLYWTESLSTLQLLVNSNARAEELQTRHLSVRDYSWT